MAPSRRTSARAATSLSLALLLASCSSGAVAFPFQFKCQPPPIGRVDRIDGRQGRHGKWIGEDGGVSRDNAPSSLSSVGGFARTAVVAAASVLLSFHPFSAGADDIRPSPPPPPSANDMGSTSIVFDAMDEIPPIEEAIMYGSKTTIIKQREVADEKCRVASAFGDLMEIDYVAKKLDPPAMVYDASVFRGTGQPFKFVLGSGVMIPGVDQGLYDMCPGEVRLLKVPPKLAVGLLDPPAKAPLEWRVELVSIEGIIRQENNGELTREDRNMGGA